MGATAVMHSCSGGSNTSGLMSSSLTGCSRPRSRSAHHASCDSNTEGIMKRTPRGSSSLRSESLSVNTMMRSFASSSVDRRPASNASMAWAPSLPV